MKWVIGVFAVAVTIVVVASFPGATAEAVSPDEELLKLFPAGTDGVGFIDVAELRDNPLVDDLVQTQLRSRARRGLDEFTERTGLDPIGDLEQVMVGRTGPDSFLVVARASYDAVRVSQFLGDRDVVSEAYLGRTLYRPQADDDWVVSFIDDLVLGGSDDAVRGAIDRLAAPDSSALDNQALAEAIASIEDGNQVWAVGAFSLLLPAGIAPPMATDLVDSLERGTYQMRLDTDLTARAIGDFASPEMAQRTTDLLRGFVALGKMQAVERTELIELLDGVAIDAVDSSVHISFEADGELLRRLGDVAEP